MSELIDREALLNECLNHYEVGNIEQNCTMDWICKTVRNFPTVSPWHRVEEELPEIGQLILLYYGGGYSIAARTEDEMWERKRYWKLEDGYWERIEDDYYWMPIKPPKEDE